MLNPDELRWDPGIVTHFSHRGITIQEILEALHGDYIVRQGHSGRSMIIGPTNANIILVIVIGFMDANTPYVATARRADRRERRIYQELRGNRHD